MFKLNQKWQCSYLSSLKLGFNPTYNVKLESYLDKALKKYPQLKSGFNEDNQDKSIRAVERLGKAAVFLLSINNNTIATAGDSDYIQFSEWTKRSSDLLSLGIDEFVGNMFTKVEHIDVQMHLRVPCGDDNYKFLNDTLFLNSPFHKFCYSTNVRHVRDIILTSELILKNGIVLILKVTSTQTKASLENRLKNKASEQKEDELLFSFSFGQTDFAKAKKINKVDFAQLYNSSHEFVQKEVLDKFLR